MTSVTSPIVSFLTAHYNSNAPILHDYGFDTVPANFLSLINATFLIRSRVGSLNIGNPSVCLNIGRQIARLKTKGALLRASGLKRLIR
jgi:hypothetical protein